MRFKEIIKMTTPAVIWNAAKSYFGFTSQRRNLAPRLYSRGMMTLLARTFNVSKMKKDRAGRLYCVVNPNLNDRGQFDTNMIIYELDTAGYNYSNNRFIEEWLARKLRIVQDLFKQRDLFGQLEFNITHVGPINHDNFLVVIQPSKFDDWQFNRKKLLKRIGVWSMIAALIFGGWLIFF